MTRYEERLARDLDAIRRRVSEVGEAVTEAVHKAVHSVLTGDRELASQTILGDLPINRSTREIDRLCHAFVAKHLPSAGHLRFVSSVLRLSIALERIGDYAVTIAREQVQLSTSPPEQVARDLDLLSDQGRRMLTQALQAFHEGNAELARGTMGMADQVERTFQRVFRDLLEAGERGSRPVADLFALLVMFNRVARVSDQAKNVCEETIFVVLGETKEPKVYKVLFLDRDNSTLSQMAEAFARRAFPKSGDYRSAGWEPREALESRFSAFMEREGYDLHEAETRSLESLRDELRDYHVIVSLEEDARAHIGELPFHTVLLEWDVGKLDPKLDQQRYEVQLQEAYTRIRADVGDLVETLRGEGAG